MGSIRPGYIKIAAKTLFQWYPDEFTVDFETNKRLVEQYTDVKSKIVRNRLAGYLVRLVRRRIADEEAEAALTAEEPIDMEM
ncbi:MAG: 30S ribosomal protein S17e [Candidatus Lokiarchaeota archaeon]|nr:30S ribosomal protein S17e [Candidatus Lokiarchaeota archaeon]